ncbi:hypothetical protein [Micromonospora sp. CV4]|uniref:hypothetical protein n=1 Tax=Micromonospora sp. CV4 TaxID=2478711 RepID=UPI0011C45607|nr:hypothetical protein [Micromonospora sp. CV4]
MTMRKFETESRVTVVVTPRLIGRQKDIKSLPGSLVEDCHLYIVSRQPRLSVDPSSVIVRDGLIRFKVRSQHGGDFREHLCAFTTKQYREGFAWKAEWPFEDFRFTHKGEDLAWGSIGALVNHMEVGVEELLEHEILYIGQAFGKDGERNAYDRLKSHSTLQAIYAENRPDYDIWLTLCEISDVSLVQDISSGEAEVMGDKDTLHSLEVLARSQNPQFYRREALTMAEAGLIRFFMPEYNEKFKNNYPDPNHVHISTAVELDFADLMVELHAYPINVRFWSPRQPLQSGLIHVARFPLRATGGLVALVLESTSKEAPPITTGD